MCACAATQVKAVVPYPVISVPTCSLREPHPHLGATMVRLFSVGGHLGCLQGLHKSVWT